MNTFIDTYDEKVRPLMDKIDQVRSVLSGDVVDGIVFPTVVVVGDQSSGKSTLLEALSMIELPKGSGIVTRCPLVLRLRKSTESNVYHLQGEKSRVRLDPDELDIRKYIEDETIKLAGKKKMIVTKMIELEIEGPSFRDLTVVDLPGIARTPIADQPEDIYGQTTNLIRRFIQPEGTIILCVFPANVDVGTVESFKLAKEVDPTGVRTIGVITKSDLAPNNDILCQQLLMEKREVLHLKLGFVAVRNRSEGETISLQNAREREHEFFERHIASTVVGWHCLGVSCLINRLADLYSDQVMEMFPKIRIAVQRKFDAASERLMNFPEELNESARLTKYHELADHYLDFFVQGKILTTSDKRGLVNILDFKFIKFRKILNEQTNELQTATYADKVARTMAAASGQQLNNFDPHYLIKHLINTKIDELWSTTLRLINDCFTLTLNLLLTHIQNEANEDQLFKRLLSEFHGIVNLYLVGQKKNVVDKLLEMTRLEKNEPYTINDDYTLLLHTLKINVSTSLPKDLQEMVCSIRAYWEVVRKRFMDYVTLTIRAAFVFDVHNGVRERLRRIPSEQCDFVEMNLGDDAQTREQRKKLQQTCDRLQKVLGIFGGRKMADILESNALTDDSELDNLERKLMELHHQEPGTSSNDEANGKENSIP